jgi:hypothetical protein
MTSRCQALDKHISDIQLLEADHDRIETPPETGCSMNGTENDGNGGTRFATAVHMEADGDDGDDDLGEEAAQEIPPYSDVDPGWDDDLAGSVHGASTVPTMDAFKNPFVRIIHVNGVHHLPLVTCSCQGIDQIPGDLMFHGLVPTTFSQYRTLATADVLDHIRYANLDLKASAWQYHRLLRRQTQPLPVEGNINLYKEIRRLSREWRWMKKLKWAGYGHGTFLSPEGLLLRPQGMTEPSTTVPGGTEHGREGRIAHPLVPGPSNPGRESADYVQASQPPVDLGDPLKPESGTLANFCAACPQVGVNLCPDWEQDPNQWVYTRFVVLDGNFKADHVRQKADDDDDIWLSNGGGMFAKQEDYHEFIRTAKQRRSVRLARPARLPSTYPGFSMHPAKTTFRS